MASVSGRGVGIVRREGRQTPARPRRHDGDCNTTTLLLSGSSLANCIGRRIFTIKRPKFLYRTTAILYYMLPNQVDARPFVDSCRSPPIIPGSSERLLLAAQCRGKVLFRSAHPDLFVALSPEVGREQG
jgi:hypothetical protein